MTDEFDAETPAEFETPRRGRGLLKLAAFFGVLVILFGGFGAYALSQARGSAEGRDVTVAIESGATASSIADTLAKAEVIRSPWLFKIIARLQGQAASLKPGEYKLRTHMSFSAVLDVLEKGPAIKFVRLTFPEGRTLGQMADVVKSSLNIPRADFLAAAASGRHRATVMPAGSKNLEGVLYPDTYFFKEDATADDVIERMIQEFEAKTAGLDFAIARSRGLSPYQALVLASLVEREAKVDEDRAKIAGVIYNRLKRGMRLEIDATAQYAIYLRDGKMPDTITESDLQIASPYNTYKIPALPPAPISSVGIASLQGALTPASHTYIFYVLSTDGQKHCFASTYDEFLAYKNRRRSCA